MLKRTKGDMNMVERLKIDSANQEVKKFIAGLSSKSTRYLLEMNGKPQPVRDESA